MSPEGSRFTDGGYQAPSTDAASLKRGRPVQSREWLIGHWHVELAVVPFTGGRPELYEIEYKLNSPVERRSIYNPCMVRGNELARQAFARTATELDAGRIPELVQFPPGTAPGW